MSAIPAFMLIADGIHARSPDAAVSIQRLFFREIESGLWGRPDSRMPALDIHPTPLNIPTSSAQATAPFLRKATVRAPL